MRNRCIYFVVGAGKTKIGIAENPEARLRSLQTESPVPLRLVGYFTGNRIRETRLHEWLKAYRLYGEWFDFEATDAFVEQCIDYLGMGDEMDSEGVFLSSWLTPVFA